jgi:hypothetical protein
MGDSTFNPRGISSSAPPPPLSRDMPIALPPLGVAPPALAPLMVASAFHQGKPGVTLGPESFWFEVPPPPPSSEEILKDLEAFWRLHGEGKRIQDIGGVNEPIRSRFCGYFSG